MRALSARSARIRHGQSARQASSGDERKLDLGPAVSAYRVKLRLSEAGEQRTSNGDRRFGFRRWRDDHPALPNKTLALILKSPTARIIGKHKNGNSRPKGEGDFTRLRPFRRNDEAGRLVEDWRFREIAPLDRLERWIDQV